MNVTTVLPEDEPEQDMELPITDGEEAEGKQAKKAMTDCQTDTSLSDELKTPAEDSIEEEGTEVPSAATDSDDTLGQHTQLEEDEQPSAVEDHDDMDEEKKQNEDAEEEATEEKSESVTSECEQKDDDTDLLLIMDEKAADDDETEFNKSIIAEAEQLAEESQKEEASENSKSPPTESSNIEEALDKNDVSENDELMDIGDNVVDIGDAPPSLLPAEDDDDECNKKDTLAEIKVSVDNMEKAVENAFNENVLELTAESDCNKENEEKLNVASDDDDNTRQEEKAIKEDGLESDPKNVALGMVTRRKRIREEMNDKQEKRKKMKLEMKENANTFSKFMLDKSLKNMTSEKLETLVLQKICESLTYKTQVAQLLKIIRDRENTIDLLRKEVVALSKQAKDLNIVHDKIMHDLERFRKNSDKPLVVPRITRSVGLQAVIRDTSKRTVPELVGLPGKPAMSQTFKTIPIQTAPAHGTPAKAVGKLNLQYSPMMSGLQVTSPTVSQTKPTTPKKSLGNQRSPSKGSPKKVTESNGAGVIDLTSEEDRRMNSATSRQPNGVSKIATPQNGQKVVMVNGQPVVVKVAGGLVSTPNGVKVMTTSPVITKTMNSSVLRTTNTTATKSSFATTPKATFVNMALTRTILPKVSHPAPFPKTIQTVKTVVKAKPLPPRPHLQLTQTMCGTGIVLCWKMPYKLDQFEDIAGYQLYAYQETKSDPSPDMWAKIGDVKAMPLPMAVTLTKFEVGYKYYFAVRAVDILTRLGAFSNHQMISL